MLRYLGGGFVPGVPARDLSAAEVEVYGGAAALIASGLYAAEAEPEAREDKRLTPARETQKVQNPGGISAEMLPAAGAEAPEEV